MPKNFEKFDDVDWHSGDAVNEVQAAVHIALVYHWLRMRGMFDDTILPTEDLDTKKVSPTQFFISQLDGQLLSEGMAPEAASFLHDYYHQTYLKLLDSQHIPGLQHDAHYKPPYNIRDSWENIEKAGEFFDKEYAAWQERGNKGSFWRKLLGK